jgi:D-glycero-alpha-D-manno-heptose-7-phosphate kinase
MLIRSRAPLRLGFAGGGTDVSPYCDLHGGAILNATIDLYATSVLRPRTDGLVRFHAADRGTVFEAPAVSEFPIEEPLVLHKAMYNHIVKNHAGGRPLALELTTYSDAPAGSGLGASSTLCVTMVQAFTEWLQLPLGLHDIARTAFQVERVELAMQGGRQDQFAAAFGGFNFMEFFAGERVIVNPLRLKPWIVAELEASLVLFYTGVSRDSAAIIDRQIQNLTTASPAILEEFHAIKRQAFEMKETLIRGDIRAFAKSLGQSWQAKKNTAAGISTSVIEEALEAGLSQGAYAGKVSGAGGGGFVMLVADPLRRVAVVRALEKLPGQVIPCHFTHEGVQTWTVEE